MAKKDQSDKAPKENKLPTITRKKFLETAKPLSVIIDGMPMGAEVKDFSTGSYGWNINGKTTIKVGDEVVNVQVGLNLTVINSKNDPK